MTGQPSVRAIVNADDLGMSDLVNDAIFELMAQGRVTSATVLANAPAFGGAARRIEQFPRCSFGVHLNLTQFEPLTRARRPHPLVDDRGQMSRAIERATPSPAVLRAAYEELCAQVERVAAAGIAITHVDSHHHVHTRPQFFPVLKAVQRRYGIRAARLSKNLYAPEQPCPPLLMWGKRAFNAALRGLYRTRTTDAFTELETYTKLSPGEKRRVRSIELMVHPGASYAAGETTILQSDWLTREVPGLALVSYRDL